MDFRILGSLDVRHRGTAVAVRGRQQPKVLAMLLLQAGQVVPVDRLVDALWDDDPPATARRQVQNTVAALRRTLAVAGQPLIAAVGEGYRLSTENLDAHQFTRIVEQGLDAAAEDRLTEAHTRLCQALELWRGPVLEDMTGRLLRAHAEQLGEARLRAFEARMDIELRLGQPGRVVVEARRLLAEHPYRQDLAGLLMRSLHQCGRGAEALEVFATLRSRLSEELGIDPSRSLRDLHLELLSSNADGFPATAPRTPPVRDAPAQLPAAIAGFTGRDRQFAELDALLDGGDGAAVLATIAGSGGIGKTALAVQWARRRADRFPDGQLFVNLHGYDHAAPLSAPDALTRLLRSFGFGSEAIPADLEEAAARYRSFLHGRRVLVVLDNAATVDQVRPLLPASPGCFTLVTSRDNLGGLTALNGARRVEVGILDQPESLNLLADLIGQSRLETETEAAARITELCGRLPLALRVVGANLAARPGEELAAVAAELAGADRLDRMVVAGDSRAAVADSIRLSLRNLSDQTREFFGRLGLVPGAEISTGLAAAVSDSTVTEARNRLTRLGQAHLIDPQGDDRWRFHDLVRLYARAHANGELPPATRDAAIGRLLDFLEQGRPRIPHEDRMATINALSGHPQVWKAGVGLHVSIHDGYDMDEIRKAATVALQRALADGDARGESMMHNIVAGTYWASRRLPEATRAGESALDTARRSGDLALISRHLGNMATFRAMSGDNLGAKRILTESLKISEEFGDPGAVSARLDTLGDICVRLGGYAEAERHLRRSLSLRPPDSAEQGWSRKTNEKLAVLCLDTGRYAEGLRLIESMIDHRGLEAERPNTLCLRGSLRLADGDPDAAHADFTAALAAERTRQYVGEIAGLMIPYAGYLSERGDQETAGIYARRCLESGRAGNLPRDEAAASLMLSMIHSRLSDFAEARDFAARARELYESMAEPLRLGRSLVALSRAHTGLGEADAAAEHRGEAEAIFGELGVSEFERF